MNKTNSNSCDNIKNLFLNHIKKTNIALVLLQ